jgi:hypothetical protein
LAAVVLVTAAHSHAANLLTVEQALALAFPGCDVEREAIFLTESQLAQANSLSGVEGQKALVTRYVARQGGRLSGFAYLDTHRVRTLPETVIVVVDPDGTIRRLEVVAFREPPEYLPPERWYRQLDGQSLNEELALKRGVRPITGATLSARAATDAARRTLAVHEVISE